MAVLSSGPGEMYYRVRFISTVHVFLDPKELVYRADDVSVLDDGSIQLKLRGDLVVTLGPDSWHHYEIRRSSHA
jgi:hypothetical protein